VTVGPVFCSVLKGSSMFSPHPDKRIERVMDKITRVEVFFMVYSSA
jgi:hypothetical protein